MKDHASIIAYKISRSKKNTHDHSIAQGKCELCAALHLFFTILWKQVSVILVKYVPCFYVENKMTCYFFVLSALPQFYQLFAREMFLLDVLPKRRELLQRLSTTSTWSCKLAAPASENRSRNHEKPELTNQVLSSVHVFSLLLRCAFEFFEDQTNKRLILWMTTLLPQLKGVLCY